MSESTDAVDAVSPALLEAVEQNPEEVAKLIERLGLVNELLDAAEFLTAAADDEMVAETVGMTALLGEAADGMATPETAAMAGTVGENAATLDSAMESLIRLEESGSLEDLVEMGEALSFLVAAMDDEMIASATRLAGTLGELGDATNDPAVTGTLNAMITSLGEAADGEPEQVGMVGMLRAMRKPEVQTGLGFLLGVAEELGGELQQNGESD